MLAALNGAASGEAGGVEFGHGAPSAIIDLKRRLKLLDLFLEIVFKMFGKWTVSSADDNGRAASAALPSVAHP